jgi:hypothetical protein
MSLPEEITEAKIHGVSDAYDDASGDLQCRIDDVMEEHMQGVIETLTELYDLTEEQQDELADRLAWRLVLLPEEN